MDEIMNNGTSDWSATTDGTSNWFVNGTSQLQFTTATDCGNVLSFYTDTTCNSPINYAQWPKGVIDYSFKKNYVPKWHITQGYKSQIKLMWD